MIERRQVAPLRLSLCLFLVVGCAPGSRGVAGFSASLSLTPQPPKVGPARVEIRLEEAGKPLEGATVRVEGNMSHPGMQPVFGDGKEVEPGRYRAPLELTMAGDWILTASITLPDGRSLEKQLNVRGVSPH